ncbi:low molecular weight protein tyrosine phosphatase family protein [Bernardetia sp.]|uniref:low molecular weight protein tyrosine phosphatase family protein n=1 Tax=Bernardetia sp. TaxID=1937974 RepID=UPI0025B91965|nr:protein-tyrosine-phosphatase [Bernardetia sp.]
MKERPNFLVVCGKNKKRSRTAEFIFKNDNRFAVRSVGVSPKSNRKITEKDVEWANLILVMEKDQKQKIKKLYSHLEIPTIEVLHIPDEYEYMDEELIEILTEKIEVFL